MSMGRKVGTDWYTKSRDLGKGGVERRPGSPDPSKRHFTHVVEELPEELF